MLFASLIVMLLAFAHSDEMLRIVMIAFGKFKVEGQAYHHICAANSSRLALPS